MHTMKRWTWVPVIAIALLPQVFADSPAAPPGVTSTYETTNAPVQSVYTVTEASHKFIAYVVEWKGTPVVVSDPLGFSDYKVGDTITFMAQKTTIDKPGHEVASLSFTLLQTPRFRRHSSSNGRLLEKTTANQQR